VSDDENRGLPNGSVFAILACGGLAMSVTLTPQLEAMIQERVESGRYSDASAVVQEALRLLEEREKLEHLRALLAVGLEQGRRGEVVEYTPEWIEDLHRRVEERLLRGDQPNPDVCP
jgi:antitoxin ParD1/3/4